MPGPVSFTAIVMVDLFWLALTLISPCAGVNFTALEIKLSNMLRSVSIFFCIVIFSTFIFTVIFLLAMLNSYACKISSNICLSVCAPMLSFESLFESFRGMLVNWILVYLSRFSIIFCKRRLLSRKMRITSACCGFSLPGMPSFNSSLASLMAVSGVLSSCEACCKKCCFCWCKSLSAIRSQSSLAPSLRKSPGPLILMVCS